MKIQMLLITVALATGCSKPPDAPVNAAMKTAEPILMPAQQGPTPPADASMPASTASATAHGTVESVDASGKTITISHGPVASLGWPAMTMTFKAPDADLSQFNEGDTVDFSFQAIGMDGTITRLGKASK